MGIRVYTGYRGYIVIVWDSYRESGVSRQLAIVDKLMNLLLASMPLTQSRLHKLSHDPIPPRSDWLVAASHPHLSS